MNTPCTKIQEQIIDLLLDNLDSEQSEIVRTHLNSCSVCQSYFEQYQNQEKELEHMSTRITNNLHEKENKTIEALHTLPKAKHVHLPLLKYAAAAIIIAGFLTLTMFKKTVPQAYALEDTIKAYNSIRWLHSYESYIFQQTLETWLKCDEKGNMCQMRVHQENHYPNDPVGSITITGNQDESEAWLPKHNLHFVGGKNPSAFIQYDVSELAPGLLFERLFEQQNQGEVIVHIEEPTEAKQPIVVTVTYPEGNRSAHWKKVFYVDPATKLVSKIEKYERKNEEFQLFSTVEFLNYNQPIDEKLFTLKADISADARVVDLENVNPGLSQGDMTSKQISEEVTRAFFQSVLDKDFDNAGRMYLGAPGFLMEKLIAENVLKIISIGPAYPDSNPDSNKMMCPFKIISEFMGKNYEGEGLTVLRPGKNSDHWVICGNITTSVKPITLKE